MKSRPIGLDGFLTNRLAYSLKSYHTRAASERKMTLTRSAAGAGLPQAGSHKKRISMSIY